MSVQRPTFSENWHRVADLRPHLRAAVRSFRQQYRGRMWHVLCDPAATQYARLDEAAFHFIALLDGKRTVDDAWKIAAESLGDASPTQNEAIALLGQLYTSNLLHAELPPDAQQMFQRYRKRVQRELRGYITNFLFAKIPLFDPNRILQQWVGIFGALFSPIGFALWCVLIGLGLRSLAGRWDELLGAGNPQLLLAPDNLVLLYACFAVTKLIHEFGHGFACAHFGKRSGTGGPVHTLGIMLLVLMPVPYVDASSSWTFRNKWWRCIVAAAGMYVELAVAALAAILWANTPDGSLTHALAFNVIFIASVSTILFNANPLLRFDGYYILCDTFELANLSQRSTQYFQYLIRRHVFGVRHAPPVAHTRGEKIWFLVYFFASFIYRILISFTILLYVAGMFFFIGFIMALAALAGWLLVPIGKFIKYLALNSELDRVRQRAVMITAAFTALMLFLLGGIDIPDRARAMGIVEPVHSAMIYAPTDAFIDTVAASGAFVSTEGKPIIVSENRELTFDRVSLLASRSALSIRRAAARADDPAVMHALTGKLESLDRQVEQLDVQIAALELSSPLTGVWVTRDAEQLAGVFVRRGAELGRVVDVDELYLRVAADQSIGPRLEYEMPHDSPVEIRPLGRPDLLFIGRITRILPDQIELPAASLGLPAGGSMRISDKDSTGKTSAEPFFEVHIAPESMTALDRDGHSIRLMPGQRVMVRFSLPARPILAQTWHALQQMFQQRFTIPR